MKYEAVNAIIFLQLNDKRKETVRVNDKIWISNFNGVE